MMLSTNFYLVTGVYLILFGGTEVLKRLTQIPAAVTRKVMHVLAAVVACMLPTWIPPAEILILSSLFIVVLSLSKILKVLSSIHDVPRKTWGEVIYPLGILIATAYVYGIQATYIGGETYSHRFLNDEGFFFGMLVLGVLDVAAEWGGRIPSPKWPGMMHKSLAGTASFFLAGIALSLIYGLPFSGTLLLGLLLLALLEAYLAYGLDNLILPIGGALLYYACQGQPLY